MNGDESERRRIALPVAATWAVVGVLAATYKALAGGGADGMALAFLVFGRHRRLRLGDVLDYKSRRAIERRKALDEMTALDAELGAYG